MSSTILGKFYKVHKMYSLIPYHISIVYCSELTPNLLGCFEASPQEL